MSRKQLAQPPAFPSGEIVGASGIYTVTHKNGPHAPEHDVVCVRGERFPVCVKCGKQPIFELKQAVPMALEHKLLEPLSVMDEEVGTNADLQLLRAVRRMSKAKS